MKKAFWLPTLAMFSMMWGSTNALSEESSTHIRTLASSCATCHGVQRSNQSAIPGLSGLDEDYFIKKMHAYRNSDKEHDVMVQHAKGLTETEIEQLATLFSQQTRGCPYSQQHPIKQPMEK
jgi:cytochrome c553